MCSIPWWMNGWVGTILGSITGLVIVGACIEIIQWIRRNTK